MVDNAKKVIKFLATSIQTGVLVAQNGSNIGADVAQLVTFGQALAATIPCFSPAVAELKALDAVGVTELVAEMAADLTLPNPKIEAIIEAILEFVPPTIKLVGALKA